MHLAWNSLSKPSSASGTANSHNMEEQTTTQRTIVASTELHERFLAFLASSEPNPVTVTISIVSAFCYYGYPPQFNFRYGSRKIASVP